MNRQSGVILLTGATGYIGGRLLRRLEDDGRHVRCMARRPEWLRERVGPSTEVVFGDVLDPASLSSALSGVHTAYYLVHSMGARGSFERQDREGSRNFAVAALAAGVRRIIYLGGLGSSDESLSSHLRSRQEVGELLRESGVPVTEFRASIVLGAGSLSFEMIRCLVERLPVMVTPRWVSIEAQPIAIRDLLDYLTRALDRTDDESVVYEVGGRDVTTYGGLMREYARIRGLRRPMIRVPLLTPRLSSLWLGLVTPLYARVGKALISSLRNPTLVREPVPVDEFRVEPMGYSEAIVDALNEEDREFAATRWADAVSASGGPKSWAGTRFGQRFVDARHVQVPAAPAAAFRPIRRIGGTRGWYYGDTLWRLRGFIDLLAGGVGMRRGRRDPEHLVDGDVVDWWRVEECQPNSLLRLAAEMRLPGRAWLQFDVEAQGDRSIIRQTVIFDPVGVWGSIYWYTLYPIHQLIFGGMLRRIATLAGDD